MDSVPQKRKRVRKSTARDASNSTIEDPIPGKRKVQWNRTLDDVSVQDDETELPELDEDDGFATCLAITSHRRRLGCAYFDATKGVLFLLEDTEDGTHWDLTKQVMEQVSPKSILTSSKADLEFTEVCRDYAETIGATFQVRPHREFIPARGKDKLLSLPFLSSPSNVPDCEHGDSDDGDAYMFMRKRKQQQFEGDPCLAKWNASIRVSSFVEADNSPFCMASAGALLDNLARVRSVGELENESAVSQITGIEVLALHQYMLINADALKSLQIFEEERHANAHSDKTKEGLSLFGILNNTKTTLGRFLLRQWFLRPSLSIPVITARHDAVSCFVHPDNCAMAGAMQGHLKGIKNVPKLIRAVQAGKATLQHWHALCKFTFHCAMLRDAVSDLSHVDGIELLEKLHETLDISNLKEMGQAIHDTIDWDDSEIMGRVRVCAHVDEELDEWKQVLNGLDSLLRRVAQEVSKTVPEDFSSSLNVVYFPQLGFLICIGIQDDWQNSEDFDVVEGWTYQFCSENHAYYKSSEMHDMDDHIGDLHTSIVDREIEIVFKLQEKISEYIPLVDAACDMIAELDCLLSFAEASQRSDYHRPTITVENVINITQGRHPLQERIVDSFVPNDLALNGGDASSQEYTETVRSMLVCTGSNACGKSVYLKQTALIQYMAQIGCFVPAESATLGITDKIFTRIQTRETVSKRQSAFMIDLNQVSLAIRNSTQQSLILLDEFGKGTDSKDGAGLFCGVLRHFLNRGAECPKVLAATHFHDIFQDDLLSPSLPINFVHMQVLITSEKARPDDKQVPLSATDSIVYLYRVADGLSLQSHAALCAAHFGLPMPIVERAQYVSDLISQHEIGQLLDEKMTEKERKDYEDAEEVCRRFLAWDLGAKDDTRSVRERLRAILGEE